MNIYTFWRVKMARNQECNRTAYNEYLYILEVKNYG